MAVRRKRRTVRRKPAKTKATKAKKKAKKKARKKKTSATLTKARRALGKLRIHIHRLPRCKGDDHHKSCSGKGQEVSCNQITVFGTKRAVCTHLR